MSRPMSSVEAFIIFLKTGYDVRECVLFSKEARRIIKGKMPVEDIDGAKRIINPIIRRSMSW